MRQLLQAIQSISGNVPTTRQDGITAGSPFPPERTTPITFNDLPGEILQEIAEFILCRDKRDGEDHELYWDTAIRNYLFVGESHQGKDVISLSASCKRLRSVLFAHNLLRDLKVYPCTRDVAIIKQLSAEDRNCVQ
jgi:hypothetical protein